MKNTKKWLPMLMEKSYHKEFRETVLRFLQAE